MRYAYHNDMSVSSSALAHEREGAVGPRARTRRLMLNTAIEMMQNGITPSVSELAEAAEVSRATAYRYFPSQAALIHAVVDEALGPILDWRSDSEDAGERVADLIGSSLPRILEFEATFRAALKVSLEQWARGKANTLGDEPRLERGHRMQLLRAAIAPLSGRLDRHQADRLAKALSLIFGLELIIVLKDMWGADDAETEEVAVWAAQSLVRASLEEAGASGAEGKP